MILASQDLQDCGRRLKIRGADRGDRGQAASLQCSNELERPPAQSGARQSPLKASRRLCATPLPRSVLPDGTRALGFRTSFLRVHAETADAVHQFAAPIVGSTLDKREAACSKPTIVDDAGNYPARLEDAGQHHR